MLPTSNAASKDADEVIDNNDGSKIKVQQCVNPDSRLWFAILDSQSQQQTHGIDNPNYRTVVGTLSQQVVDHVQDILRYPPDNDKYGRRRSTTAFQSIRKHSFRHSNINAYFFFYNSHVIGFTRAYLVTNVKTDNTYTSIAQCLY